MVNLHPTTYKDSGIVVTFKVRHGRIIYNPRTLLEAIEYLKKVNPVLYNALDEETLQEYDKQEPPSTFDTNKYTQFLGAVIVTRGLFPVKEVNFGPS